MRESQWKRIQKPEELLDLVREESAYVTILRGVSTGKLHRLAVGWNAQANWFIAEDSQ